MDHQTTGSVLNMWKHPPGWGRGLSVSVELTAPRQARPPAKARQVASWGALGGLPLSLAQVVGSLDNSGPEGKSDERLSHCEHVCLRGRTWGELCEARDWPRDVGATRGSRAEGLTEGSTLWRTDARERERERERESERARERERETSADIGRRVKPGPRLCGSNEDGSLPDVCGGMGTWALRIHAIDGDEASSICSV